MGSINLGNEANEIERIMGIKKGCTRGLGHSNILEGPQIKTFADRTEFENI